VKKKLLTLEDLVKFCKAQKMYNFSANDEDGPIYVQVPAAFKKKEVEDPAYLYVDLKAFHTGRNRNTSSVTYDAAKKSLDTFSYKPILAAFMTKEDGEEDFTTHEMELDEDGNVVYIEHPVGCFTTDKPRMEKDSEHEDRYYIYATGVIYREYSHAADIIERKDGTKVSVELMVNEFQYDEEEDLLLLTDIEVSGITLLGTNPETGDPVEEGMEGARLDIKDFSRDNNSVFAKEEIKQFIQDSIREALDNINSQRKEENNQMNHFEELLEKYGKTVEEITFAYEGLSDEELDAAFAEAFETAPEPENPEPQGESVEFSVTYKGETKTFAKSLNDQIKEITELVNATYGGEDNDYYDCEVFDDKTVLFHGWYQGRHFKQRYGNKEGNLVLKGERTEVFVRYLTEEELAALEELKSKFEAISKDFEAVSVELGHYKDEPKKMEALEAEDYSALSENAEFAALKTMDVHFEMSIEDVKAKADAILLAAAKAGKVDFSKKEESHKKPILNIAKVSGTYGNLIKDAKGLH
jgi:hypothetical protein